MYLTKQVFHKSVITILLVKSFVSSMVAKKTNFGSVLFVPDIKNITLLNHIIILTHVDHMNEFQGEFERRG